VVRTPVARIGAPSRPPIKNAAAIKRMITSTATVEPRQPCQRYSRRTNDGQGYFPNYPAWCANNKGACKAPFWFVMYARPKGSSNASAAAPAAAISIVIAVMRAIRGDDSAANNAGGHGILLRAAVAASFRIGLATAIIVGTRARLVARFDAGIGRSRRRLARRFTPGKTDGQKADSRHNSQTQTYDCITLELPKNGNRT